VREAHFRRAIGQRVSVRTKAPVGDRRQFHGVLERVEGETVVLADPAVGSVALRLGDIEKAHVEFDFARPAGVSHAHARGHGDSMLPDLNRVIEQVSKEKGIDRTIIIEAVKDAMLSAARRTYGPDKKLEAQYNPEIGEVELFEIRVVVDDVQDPQNEVALDEARRTMDPDAEVGDELLQRLATDRFGASPR